jgi:POT family proton-dependent oligopeptide transporter
LATGYGKASGLFFYRRESTTGETMSGEQNNPNDAHPKSNALRAAEVEFDREPDHAVPPGEIEMRQPPGLWVLFITEMWERFSYYGMRALFVLFLIASADKFLPADLGFKSDEAATQEIVAMLAAQQGVPADQITADATLSGDLAMSPADKTALVASLETRFNVPFPMDAATLDKIKTVGDLAAFVTSKGKGDENQNPGFGWQRDQAYTLYGVYTFMVYLTAIFGGMVADRCLGTHRSMILGGSIIALGHIVLAAMMFFPYELGTTVSETHGYSALLCFLIGCTLIIIGTGFFKPCVSVMVGQLYERNDPRRDSGFTIFYMGINLGAFFSPLVAGYLGEKIGWHWGFGSAAVGMVFGLLFYGMARGRYLGSIGDPPSGPITGHDKKLVVAAAVILIGIPVLPLLILAAGGLPWVTAQWSGFTEFLGLWGMTALIVGVVLFSAIAFLFAQPSVDRGPLAVILILAFIGNIFFWTAFEQAGSSMNVFAKEHTDLTLWGLIKGGIPASFFQSVNPLTILLFGPIFSWLWLFLERKNADPSTPMKFAMGLWLLGLAFLAMVAGALDAKDGLAGAQWLLITYVVYTWGELCLSPVGLSMVTKLAPPRLQSLMMGLWFFTFALSNLLAGLVARFSERFVPESPDATAELSFIIPGLPGFFLMLVALPIAGGIMIAILSPMLKRMMHGVE